VSDVRRHGKYARIATSGDHGYGHALTPTTHSRSATKGISALPIANVTIDTAMSHGPYRARCSSCLTAGSLRLVASWGRISDLLMAPRRQLRGKLRGNPGMGC
jgi:hypothetical protein